MKLNKLSAQAKLIIIAVLIILIGVGYYFLVFKAYNTKEEKIKSDITAMQGKIDAENTKIAGINKRKKDIEQGKALGSIVFPADNSNTEAAFLSSVIKRNATTGSYSIGGAQKSETYVRRNVSVSCVSPSDAQARAVLDEISSSGLRNIITNVSMTASGKNGFSSDGDVSCSFTVTFIESVKDTTPVENEDKTEEKTEPAQEN